MPQAQQAATEIAKALAEIPVSDENDLAGGTLPSAQNTTSDSGSTKVETEEQNVIKLPSDVRGQGALIKKLNEKAKELDQIAELVSRAIPRLEARADRPSLKQLLEPAEKKFVPLQFLIGASLTLTAVSSASEFISTGGIGPVARGVLLSAPFVVLGLVITPKLGRIFLDWCKHKGEGIKNWFTDYPAKRGADKVVESITVEIFKHNTMSLKDGSEFLRSLVKEYRNKAAEYRDLGIQVTAARDATKDERLLALKTQLNDALGVQTERLYLRSKETLWDHLYQQQSGPIMAKAMLTHIETALKDGKEPVLIDARDPKLFALNSELIPIKSLTSLQQRHDAYSQIAEKLRLMAGILEKRGDAPIVH